MNRLLSALVVALMAATAMTAPTPTKTITKRSFLAKSKGHGKPSPKEAMQRAAQKYGFEISVPESDIKARHWDHDSFSQADNPWSWLSAFLPGPSASASIIFISSGVPLPSGSAAPSSGGVPFPSSSAIPSSGGVPFPSGSAIPSSGGVPFPSGSAIPSSGGPPAQSSAPSSAQPSSPAPSSSTSPGGGNDTGEVSADPEDNESMYLSPVTIGGNQQLDLDFDTGSSDLWVMTPQVASGSGVTAFDSSKSSSFQTYQGGSWEISYGDGSSASGSVGFDSVTIGGLTAQKQCVELAEQVSSSFLQGRNLDGLLGLAFSSINTVQPQQQKTFWENVMPELEQPLFTADLEEDNSGTYEFGKLDSSKYSGQVHYTPVDNSQGFWQIASESFTVGSSKQDCSGCSPSIVDTGTSLMIMDDQIVEAYYKQVQGAQNSATYGGFVYPCSTTPPDFAFSFGGYDAVIKGSDITYAQADSSGSVCFGGIQPGASQAGFNILGDVLLKQFFAVFDGGNMQFGIAAKN